MSDHEALAIEFYKLKARVEPMLEDYEEHRRDRADGRRKQRAHEHLEAGELDKAGEALGLQRSHGGEEKDESYQRRLAAEIHGAAEADAEKARPSDAAPPEGAKVEPPTQTS